VERRILGVEDFVDLQNELNQVSELFFLTDMQKGPDVSRNCYINLLYRSKNVSAGPKSSSHERRNRQQGIPLPKSGIRLSRLLHENPSTDIVSSIRFVGNKLDTPETSKPKRKGIDRLKYFKER
jgi:hypothetical protein